MTHTISEAAQIKIVQRIAKELGVGPQQVATAVALLDGRGPGFAFTHQPLFI